MRIIRRYPNRKFYDTGESCHIRLERVAELIRLGEDVRVFDKKTGRDITTTVYAQILAAEERRVPRLSVAGLAAIIRRGLE